MRYHYSISCVASHEQVSAGVVEKVFHLFDVALRMQYVELNAGASASAAATYANETSAEVQNR